MLMLPEDFPKTNESTAESGKYFLTCGHKGENNLLLNWKRFR